MSVFVLGSDNRPVMPCSEKRARLLLERKRAYVVRMAPFTIKMKDRSQDNCELQDLEVKIDPGSKFTGICISRTENKTVNVLNLFELENRGEMIKRNLLVRSALRRNRRNRKTRYRQSRFLNRTKPKGWLPPSLRHRIDTTMSWVNRFQKWLPVTMLAVERVKFDMQKLRDPEVSGIEYQQGTLFQYEVTEYLLEKWNRECAYCGVKDVPLEKEHIVPKSKGGTNAISNLCLACRSCNQAKGSLDISVFLAKKPDLLKKILSQVKRPLKDAAAVNATRNQLFKELLNTGLPVATGTGAETKFNRSKLTIPKTHALDAACVGNLQEVRNWAIPHIGIKCSGRGSYCRTITDKYGFPKIYFSRLKKAFGFQSGDMVKAVVKNKVMIGRVTIRQNGRFTLSAGKIKTDIGWRYCKVIQRTDGYSYSVKKYSFIIINGRTMAVVDR